MLGLSVKTTALAYCHVSLLATWWRHHGAAKICEWPGWTVSRERSTVAARRRSATASRAAWAPPKAPLEWAHGRAHGSHGVAERCAV